MWCCSHDCWSLFLISYYSAVPGDFRVPGSLAALGPLPNSHGDLTCAAQNSEGAHKERCSGRIGEVRAK